VIPEVRYYLDKAHQCLTDAKTIVAFPIPQVAAKEAYLAGYHAAAAFIFARTGKIAKTHTGVRVEFSKLAHKEPRIDRSFLSFLAQAYELKSIADYGVGPIARISVDDAKAVIETAERFIERIAELLSQPDAPP
jgi:uncharacterized protein (UPF0332 family)